MTRCNTKSEHLSYTTSQNRSPCPARAPKSLTTVCPADRPCPLIFAKILKQTLSQNPSTDTKLLICLFATHTHHAQQLKARPDPAKNMLCCASAGNYIEHQGQEPPPRTPAQCTRPLYRPLYRHRSLARFLGVSGKGHFAEVPPRGSGAFNGHVFSLVSPASLFSAAGLSYFLGQCFALF